MNRSALIHRVPIDFRSLTNEQMQERAGYRAAHGLASPSELRATVIDMCRRLRELEPNGPTDRQF